MDLMAEAARRFPNSKAMQAAWIKARSHAANVPQRWGAMVPMTMDALRDSEAQFLPRSLREARITL